MLYNETPTKLSPLYRREGIRWRIAHKVYYQYLIFIGLTQQANLPVYIPYQLVKSFHLKVKQPELHTTIIRNVHYHTAVVDFYR